MFKIDKPWFGAIVGIVLPGIAFFFVEILKKNIKIFEKDDLLYVGCVAINLFLVRYFVSQHKEQTARGIIGSTFICAFIFFFYKTHQ